LGQKFGNRNIVKVVIDWNSDGVYSAGLLAGELEIAVEVPLPG